MCPSFPNKSPLLCLGKCPFGTSLQSLFTGSRPNLSYSLPLVTFSNTVLINKPTFAHCLWYPSGVMVAKGHGGNIQTIIWTEGQKCWSLPYWHTQSYFCAGWNAGVRRDGRRSASTLGSHPIGVPCPMPQWFQCTFLFVEPSNGTQD